MGNSSGKQKDGGRRKGGKASFTRKELKAVRKVFHQVTKGRADRKDDSLSEEEFVRVFEVFTKRTNELQHVNLQEIFDNIDRNKDGRVSFNELILWLSIYLNGSDDDKLRHMFETFDEDKNGVLEAAEVTNVLGVLKLSMTDRGLSESRSLQKASALLKKLVSGGDGTITLQQWLQIGAETNLMEELLGEEFLELMSGFNVHK
ncbi:Kv channel-interacting protein 4 [Balamuthia mandrillaris]